MNSYIDEQLIIQYREGNDDAFHEILKLYSPLISRYCRKFFAPGLQKEDLFQEGCIGLYHATYKFRLDGGATFKSIARLHIQNQIINAVKAATRKKQQMLNYSFSLNAVPYDCTGDETYIDILSSGIPTPEEIVIRNEEDLERKRVVEHIANSFSPTEKLVFVYYIKGFTYKEIAQKVGTGFKSVDNAIKRIKVKVMK